MALKVILSAVIGVASGMWGGMLGLGGGTLIVPALVYIFRFSQHKAQGTALAMLVPPIGFLAAWTYYKQGYVDLIVAVCGALGFFLGGLLGAKFAVGIPDELLRKIFGVAMLLIALNMIFR